MTVKFSDYAVATVHGETVDGQEVERRLEFSLNGLDYIFVFSPPSDDPDQGATLTYVGDEERGRLSPSKYADDAAWVIAEAKFGLPGRVIASAK